MSKEVLLVSSKLYFFGSSLYSFYREIPINRLIIGDVGSTDDSLEILKKLTWCYHY